LIHAEFAETSEITAARDAELGYKTVIRTIWFASFGLALVGASLVTKVVSAMVPEQLVMAVDPPSPRTALLRYTSTKPDQTAASRTALR
jgi:hypothetical protein